MKQVQCETVYGKELLHWLFPELANSLQKFSKSLHIDGVTWKPDDLTKQSQWWLSLNIYKKLSLV